MSASTKLIDFFLKEDIISELYDSEELPGIRGLTEILHPVSDLPLIRFYLRHIAMLLNHLLMIRFCLTVKNSTAPVRQCENTLRLW